MPSLVVFVEFPLNTPCDATRQSPTNGRECGCVGLWWGGTFPALQCTRIGWFRLSRMVSRAPIMEVSGMTTKGSLFPGMGNWKKFIPADFKNARFSSGYVSCTRVLPSARSAYQNKKWCRGPYNTDFKPNLRI